MNNIIVRCLPNDKDANFFQSMKHTVQHYDQKTVNFLFLFSIYCYFLFAFKPCKFCKIAPINFAKEIFTKNLEMHCFKRQRYKVAYNYIP